MSRISNHAGCASTTTTPLPKQDWIPHIHVPLIRRVFLHWSLSKASPNTKATNKPSPAPPNAQEDTPTIVPSNLAKPTLDPVPSSPAPTSEPAKEELPSRPIRPSFTMQRAFSELHRNKACLDLIQMEQNGGHNPSSPFISLSEKRQRRYTVPMVHRPLPAASYPSLTGVASTFVSTKAPVSQQLHDESPCPLSEDDDDFSDIEEMYDDDLEALDECDLSDEDGDEQPGLNRTVSESTVGTNSSTRSKFFL